MAGEMRGRALYSFEGQEDQNELSFKKGDEVMVFRKDVGDGWWEGQINGKVGLFPETYVELFEGGDSGDDEDYEEHEDWEDHRPVMDLHLDQQESNTDHHTSSSSLPTAAPAAAGPAFHDNNSKATLRRAVNRFSGFVNSGAEGFMRGDLKPIAIDQASMLHIQNTPDGLIWTPNPQPYPSIAVAFDGPRKKFMQTFEVFKVTGGSRSGSVERRYKHFTWLHERLQDKYSCICVPPMPDRQYMSKFGEKPVEKRQQKLQQWVNRVARHPVLSRDELALRHFLTCASSDVKTWKQGKKRAKEDPVIGGQFFKTVSPDHPCPKTSDKEIETFSEVVREMTAVLRRNQDITLTHADRMHAGFSREFKRIGDSMKKLSQTFSKGVQANGDSVKLSMAIFQCGEAYESVAKMWEQQPSNDQIPLFEGYKEYLGMLGQFGEGLSSCREASLKLGEINALETAEPAQKEAVHARRDLIHSLMLCEVAHFHKSRREDFKEMMKAYLSAQIQFYEKIAARLKQAKAEFDNLPY